MDKEMKSVEQIHREWKEHKRFPLIIIGRLTYAADHFDLLLNHIYDRDEYIALLKKQIDNPEFLRDVDEDADAR